MTTMCYIFRVSLRFHVALKALGGECVFASEIHPSAREQYAANFHVEADHIGQPKKKQRTSTTTTTINHIRNSTDSSRTKLAGDIRQVASREVQPRCSFIPLYPMDKAVMSCGFTTSASIV